MVDNWVRLTLCILQVRYVDLGMEGHVPADVLDMGTPG
jgi:hypothetical protein